MNLTKKSLTKWFDLNQETIELKHKIDDIFSKFELDEHIDEESSENIKKYEERKKILDEQTQEYYNQYIIDREDIIKTCFPVIEDFLKEHVSTRESKICEQLKIPSTVVGAVIDRMKDGRISYCIACGSVIYIKGLMQRKKLQD